MIGRPLGPGGKGRDLTEDEFATLMNQRNSQKVSNGTIRVIMIGCIGQMDNKEPTPPFDKVGIISSLSSSL